MITQGIFIIVAIFLVLGGVDYLLDNRYGLGSEFEAGIKAVGSLALNMIGIFILVPLVTDSILQVTRPIAQMLHMDASILPASILAVDMGGFQLGTSLATNVDMGLFSGIILASNLGATLSFSIPVALGMIHKEDLTEFLQGLVIGIICIPFGSLVGGLVQGIPLSILLANMLPLMVLVILLGVFIMWQPISTIKFFKLLSKGIVVISIIGLIIVGVTSIIGIDTPRLDLTEAALVVTKIGIFLAGAYPMLKVLNKVLKKPLVRVGKLLDVNEETVTGLIGNLASNLLLFSQFHQMNTKGKVMAGAFAISGAFVFGGQLAFVNTVAGNMVMPFIISKLAGGIMSIGLAYAFCSYQARRKVSI